MGEAEQGWYDDGAGRQRWWDGSSWTNRYLDEEPPKPPPPPAPGTAYHPKMDAAAAPDLQPKKSGRGALWGCLGCIGVVVVVAGIVAVAGAMRGSEPYDANNRYEAISQCEARIETQLRSPATAEFNSDAQGNGTWTVTGTVDAENGFGAMIRGAYQCTVVIKGDKATTTIDYFE